MPIISSFFGITIRMYFTDHAPLHIHVDYQVHEALIAIEKRVRLDHPFSAIVQALSVDNVVSGKFRRTTGGRVRFSTFLLSVLPGRSTIRSESAS